MRSLLLVLSYGLGPGFIMVDLFSNSNMIVNRLEIITSKKNTKDTVKIIIEKLLFIVNHDKNFQTKVQIKHTEIIQLIKIETSTKFKLKLLRKKISLINHAKINALMAKVIYTSFT